MRHRVNKGRSVRSFRRKSKFSRGENMAIGRGGWRL